MRFLPNLLSGSRLLLGILLFGSIADSRWELATLIFWVAIGTDLADGFLARKFTLSSTFGGLLDHGCDAFFVTCGLAALAGHAWVPWMLVILVPAAFIQYMLDSGTLAGRPLRTSQVGKYNGISYYVFAGLPIMQLSLGVEVLPFSVLIWVGWGLVITTLISMIDRLLSLWRTWQDPR